MMEELAARLKAKREKLGIGLEEAVDKTKLHPSMIKALEAGRWEEVSPGYLKGFLKIYCSFLEVPFDEAEISPLKKTKEKNIPLDKSQKTAQKKYFDIKTFSFILESKFLRVFLVGALVLFGIFSLVKKIRNKSPSEEAATSAISSGNSMGNSEKEVSSSSGEMPLADSDSLYVSLITKKDCYVTVKVEGKMVFEGILKKGIVEAWKANKEIELKLSDGSAVEIEVNGKLLPRLTKTRRPIKSLKITPAGISVEK